LRIAAHWRQLQFHCGKPPPAADPRTRMCMGNAPEGRPGQRNSWPGEQSAVGEIHRHFEANAQIGKRGFSPHGSILFLCRTIPVKPLMHGAPDTRMLLSNEVAACIGRGCCGVSETAKSRASHAPTGTTQSCRSRACSR
jgi:hypothetical protein